MPTFKITDPNTGRVARITGDRVPTGDEIRKIFEQVPQQSVEPAPTRVSRPPLDIEARRREAIGELAQEGGAIQDFFDAFALGALNLQRGVGLIGEGGRESEALLSEALREKSPIAATTGEILGESAPFIGLGVGAGAIPAFAGRVATAGGLGLLEGGISARGRGENIAERAATTGTIAASLEAILPSAIRIGSSLVRRVTGRAATTPVIDAAGRPSQELLDALNKSGLSFEDLGISARNLVTKETGSDPAELVRKAFLEQQGLSPTQAQVTRRAGDFQTQQELAKTSGAVRSALEEQQAALTSRFDTGIEEAVGAATSPSSSVSEAILGKASVLDNQIGQLYKQAREAAAGGAEIKLDKLASSLKSLQGSDKATGGAVSSVIGDLKNKGILDNNLEVIGDISIEQAEEARKLMNQLFDPQNGFRNIKLRELKDALDEDVLSTAGRDVFADARKAKRDFEAGLDKAKLSKFDSTKSNIVRDILENKIDPDDMINKVVLSSRTNATDLKQLKRYLDDAPNGKEAFNDLRGDTMEFLKEKAFTGPIDSQGFQAFNVDGLRKALGRIKKPKMDVLFSKQEQKFLTDLAKTGKILQPVRGTGIGKGPSAQALENQLSRMLTRLPFIGDIIGDIKVTGEARKLLKARPSRRAVPTQPIPSTVPASTGIAAESTKED